MKIPKSVSSFIVTHIHVFIILLLFISLNGRNMRMMMMWKYVPFHVFINVENI